MGSSIRVLGVLLRLKKPSSAVINVLFILYCSQASPQLALHVLFSACNPLKHPSLFYIILFYKTFVALYVSHLSSQSVSGFKQVEGFIIFLSLSMWHRWDQSEHEDEADFGNSQPAFYPSVGGLHGQQTNAQVRIFK